MSTNFPNGITTAQKTETLGRYGLPAPIKWHTYFDDFDLYVAADWTVTEVGVATQALADEDGGVLLVTNAAVDDDSSFSQKVGESFLFEVGKRLIFQARLKVSDATQSDFVMGLQITDTTPLAVTDGVFFLKTDAAATLDFLVEKDSVASTATAVGTVVDATFITMGFDYNGVDKVTVYVDDVRIQDVAVTNLPDDEELAISFGVQNGEGAAKTMSVDYIFCAKER